MTKQQTEALKPCPFCGAKAVHREYDDRYPYEAFGLIVDHSPECFLNLLRRQDGTFTAWNTRALATPSPAPSDTLGVDVSGKRLLRDEYIRLTVTRDFAEREKGECSLGCSGEFDDGRCGLKYDSPCCVYRKALRDDAALNTGGSHD